MKTRLTEKGKEMLLAAMTGDELCFTKIVLGNGISDGSEALKNPIMEAEISTINVAENYVTITSLFVNSEVESGFRATEAGIYAARGDEDVLYAIAFTDEGSADYIPGKAERLMECQYDFIVFIGEAQNISAAINSSIVYVTSADFEKHIADKNNPHGVDKKAVGLGNVPNVATDDQTPTVGECLSLSTPKTGEKLPDILGKLAYAAKSLISHIANKNNPHNVTASKIGAAATKHTHSVTDMNTGVLPPERGGTGKTSIEDFISFLAKNLIVSGLYIGNKNGENLEQTIDLGFYPQAVIVFGAEGVTRDMGDTSVSGSGYNKGGMAIRGYNATGTVGDVDLDELSTWPDFNKIGLTETGFRVRNHSNLRGVPYYYIAFR